MDITWYGLSCFRIREAGATVICDPYDKTSGLTLPKLRADIVTVSHDRPGHNAVDRVQVELKVLRGPGEYEVNNIFVTGATTYHRKQSGGAVGERNVVFFFQFGDITIGHLGDVGELPTQAEIEELNLGEVDILLVPVGGGATLDPTRAVEVIGLFDPKIVIPMHYQQPGLAAALADLEPLDKFLKEFGATAPEPLEMFKTSKSGLPEETQVVVLKAVQL